VNAIVGAGGHVQYVTELSPTLEDGVSEICEEKANENLKSWVIAAKDFSIFRNKKSVIYSVVLLPLWFD